MFTFVTCSINLQICLLIYRCNNTRIFTIEKDIRINTQLKKPITT